MGPEQVKAAALTWVGKRSLVASLGAVGEQL